MRIPLKAVLRELNRRGEVQFANDIEDMKKAAEYAKQIARMSVSIANSSKATNVGRYLIGKKAKKLPDIDKIGKSYSTGINSLSEAMKSFYEVMYALEEHIKNQ